MQALSHSPFLQALGYAIANSFWQIALLWLIVVVLNGVVKSTAAARYILALTAQLAGFAWFIITFRVYYNKCAEALSTLQLLQLPSSYFTQSGTVNSSNWMQWILKIEQLLPFLSVAYLCLLVFLGIKWSRSYIQAQQIRHSGLEKIAPEWRVFVQQAALHLGIKAQVHIYLSSLVKSPLTAGFLKPVILVPLASINHLTSEQMEAVILHELAHIKRADYLIHLLQTVIEITLFFNPFTRLLSTLIHKERENSCDDWVLQFQYNPSMYAQALLNIARLQQQPVLAMPATGHKGDLLARVKRMLNKQEHEFDYKRHLSALLLMTGILVAVAWLSPASSTTLQVSATQQAALPQQQVEIEPISVSVKNPLFSPVFFLSSAPKPGNSKAIRKISAPAPPATPNAPDTLQAPPPPAMPDAPAVITVATDDQPGTVHFIRTVMSVPGNPASRPGRRAPEMNPEHGMGMIHIFGAFEPRRIKVHPPFLIDEPDFLPRFKRGGRGHMDLPPSPVMAMSKQITPAMVLERMLHNGNDSTNQLLIASIAQASNSADSMVILRQFYKNTWQQQFKQHRAQIETENRGKKLQHWAFYNPVYIESNNGEAFIEVKQTENNAPGTATKDSSTITGNSKELTRYQYHNGDVTITIVNVKRKQVEKVKAAALNAASITQND
ncbi:Signal transducer regulating beta-lactamase production, contains metallopeptidase domain [Filimonas lacunae]|uniref:Signal transducer regulating beta-lactamase production, contains metallopeptidase domain n=1 Tax=Filimonas lacunae TaxID=477680 RepID=A0A173MFG8_9BACT|nr:M56 family metallopeptidase [Filimonas lacunae]BAV06240.1 regulatory sensor-transducer, BlaR1/MecR1 family [Filimonas lacunae]SIT25415.1 Signal transducer regulating beta-lactamase production, contains metallopeptidase domain [Filimonas lacunae]